MAGGVDVGRAGGLAVLHGIAAGAAERIAGDRAADVEDRGSREVRLVVEIRPVPGICRDRAVDDGRHAEVGR